LESSWCHLEQHEWATSAPASLRELTSQARYRLRSMHNLERLFAHSFFWGEMVKNSIFALTVIALGCFCGNVALASSATFTISPNPAATGQAIAVTAKIAPGIKASSARLTLWLYNAGNSAYVGQVSLTGLSYTVSQTTTTTIALPSKLAAGSYYFNPSLYTSSGTGLWGTTHAATFTVGSAGSVGGTKSCTFNAKTIVSGSSVTAYLASSVPSGQTCKSQARTCSNGALSGTYAYASCSVQGASAGHSIKWNPGHYMTSNAIMGPGGQFTVQPPGTWNQFLTELNQLNNQDNVVGYSVLVYWSALEPSQDKYDFSQISALLSYLKTHFNKSKHLVLTVMPGKFTSTDARGAIPNYIASNPMYGPSPVAGSYGWWGGKGNGVTSAAALHRPAVMERWIKLHEKLGAAFNGDPSFEAIKFQEDSWVNGASMTNGAPDWNGATALVNWENLITSTTAAFPNTSVIVENTWFDKPLRTQQLEDFMLEHRVAPGTMDVYGQTWVDQHGGALNNWGLNEYAGKAINADSPALGPDMRSRMHSMLDIEASNLGVYTSSIGWTPADICVALNRSNGASHAFWANLGNNNTSRPSANWSNVQATINKCPLVNTDYPQIYP
jgi:hypothetical protein